jgi:cytochrome P450
MDIDFFDPDVNADPYPYYEEVRAAGRVVWNGKLQAWMVTGFDDCQAVFADPACFSNAQYRDPAKVWWFDAPNMVLSDPPEHHRLRNPLSPMFTRSAVAKWETRIGEIVDELIAPLVVDGVEFEIVRDFTMIPTVIVAEMMGVPKEHHEDFRRWSHTIAGSASYGLEDAVMRARMAQAGEELKAYLAEEIERHRRERPDDVLTVMLEQPPDVRMSDAEILSTVEVLLIAGYDTTAKLMGNCLVELERHPDARKLVAEDPMLVPSVIEEVLRWCGVLHGVLRTIERDTVFAGTELRRGQLVCTMTGAANRDPSRWPDPLEFDVSRAPKAHLGFGYGPHLCIGAPLARLETKVAMERLLRLAPDYHVRDVDYGNEWFIRGPHRGVLELGADA